jgi:molecular chaperone IbpA
MTRISTLDLPSFTRTSIGFDRLFDEMDRMFMNSSQNSSYPPYNIAKINDDEYAIQVAVAGFTEEELDVTLEKGILRIEGRIKKTDEEVIYLHKGVGGRQFRREFRLADYVEVVDAGLVNGMLTVTLKRVVPEELQPKKIKITSNNVIDGIVNKVLG